MRHFKPYTPNHFSRRNEDDCDWHPMVMHAIVLLRWASEHRSQEASITIISKETGIPRMSLAWILKDYVTRRESSTIARVARSTGYDFLIYKAWNKDDKYKRKKKIIDAVKINDPAFSEKDY